jgi:ribonuclease HI
MYFDGSLTLNGARGDVVLILPKGDRLQYVLRRQFKATNNVAMYKALVNCLQLAVLGASTPKVTLNWS